MGDLILKRTVTQDDFLKYLESIPGKAEFIDGEILDLGSGSYNHGLIASNFSIAIGKRILDRDCSVLSSDVMIYAELGNAHLFPDFSIACGDPEFLDGNVNILKNPLVVVEVISPSSAEYDRGVKQFKYMSVASLRSYVVVSQDEELVSVTSRLPSGEWGYAMYHGLDSSVFIPALNISVPLAEIYRRTIKVNPTPSPKK